MTAIASSVEKAACLALHTFLEGWAGLAGVTISEAWPAADTPLPDKAISVLLVGKRQELPLDPRVVSAKDTSPADPVLKVYRWQVAACRHGIQIDVWSKYEDVRDELKAELDKALHAGVATTLGAGYHGTPFRDGPLLPLDADTGHEGFADFTFDGPAISDNAESVRQREYRATYAGEVAVNLELEATAPRIKAMILRALSHGTGGVADDFTFTGDDTRSFSYTHDPP